MMTGLFLVKPVQRASGFFDLLIFFTLSCYNLELTHFLFNYYFLISFYVWFTDLSLISFAQKLWPRREWFLRAAKSHQRPLWTIRVWYVTQSRRLAMITPTKARIYFNNVNWICLYAKLIIKTLVSVDKKSIAASSYWSHFYWHCYHQHSNLCKTTICSKTEKAGWTRQCTYL